MARTTRTLMTLAVIAAAFSAFVRPVTAERDPRPIAIHVDDDAHPSPAGLAAVALTASSMVGQTKATDEHVRSPQAVVNILLREGAERSVTFSALVETLNGSDVVAYVESRVQMRTGLDGVLNPTCHRGGKPPIPPHLGECRARARSTLGHHRSRITACGRGGANTSRAV